MSEQPDPILEAARDAMDGCTKRETETWGQLDQRRIYAAIAAIEPLIRAQIAGEIWSEEQRATIAANIEPLNSHLSGVLRGLQRARDIARGDAQ